MPHSRVLVRCAVLTATLLVPAVLAPAASAEPRGALVTVVHGVRVWWLTFALTGLRC